MSIEAIAAAIAASHAGATVLAMQILRAAGVEACWNADMTSDETLLGYVCMGGACQIRLVATAMR
jgi:hypothetical protein